MNNPKKIMLLVIPDDIHTGVIESQMFGLATYYGDKYQVIIGMPKKHMHKYENVVLSLRFYSSYKDLFHMLHRVDIVYFRSIVNYIYLFLFCRIKSIIILYDFRGLSSYETYFKQKKLSVFLILYIIEYFVYRTADQIQCVSNNMVVFMEQKYGYRNIQVVPCMTHQTIFRNERLQGPAQFVYVGGTSLWQNLDKIISLAEYIQEKIEAKFTFVTNEVKEMQSIISNSKLDKYEIHSGDNDFAVKILRSQDFGFLLRDDTIFNKLASPIKFMEYVANGVVPIVTLYVGDYSAHVQKYKMGIIYNYDDKKFIQDVLKVSQMIGEYRLRMFNYSSRYSWEKQTYEHSIESN